MSATPATFEPGDKLTPANVITMLRLVITIPFLAAVVDGSRPWLIFVVWTILCLSDWVDGSLARKQGVTRSGAFLDPLADKVLVLGILWVLVSQQELWWVPVAIISLREAVIQGFRTYWGRYGLAVPASKAAKLKTIVQEYVAAWVLFPPTHDWRWLISATMVAAVALTLYSGAEYLMAGSQATRTTGARNVEPGPAPT